jgi:hypothetical protein
MAADDDAREGAATPPESRASTTPREPRAGKRAYHTPTIRHLGCVRDLALGGASGFAEGAGTFIRPRM